MLSRSHLFPLSVGHPAARAFRDSTPASAARGVEMAAACPEPSASPSGAAFDARPKIQLELASSDPSCLTALSTCPTVQLHKQFARLSSSQGSRISPRPTSDDFSRHAVTDAGAHPAPHPRSHLWARSPSPLGLGVASPSPEAQKHEGFILPPLKQGFSRV